MIGAVHHEELEADSRSIVGYLARTKRRMSTVHKVRIRLLLSKPDPIRLPCHKHVCGDGLLYTEMRLSIGTLESEESLSDL
jgi:hypothetical protein